MTTHFSEVQDGKKIRKRTKSSPARTWLYLGMVPVVGLAYAAGTLTASGSESPPLTDRAPATAALGQPSSHAEPPGNSEVDHAEQVPTPLLEDSEELEAGDPPAAQDEPPGGAFFVQTAAYQDLQDAEHYVANLAERGLRAGVAAAPGSRWHSVRLGPFDTRAEAEKARFQLKQEERKKAYVTPRSNGKYHVQVGSFATRDKAEPVAQRFTAAGHDTKISRVKMGEQYWHCVRIGPFDSAEEAQGYRELISDVPEQAVVIPYGPPQSQRADGLQR